MSPIDISGEYLEESARARRCRNRGFRVYPVVADFTKEVTLPAEIGLPQASASSPGSTIGNFVPRSATDLLRHFRDMLGAGAKLLIGMDRVKPVERLIAPMTTRRASPPSSTSTCSSGSTASWAPTSTSTLSPTRRAGTT